MDVRCEESTGKERVLMGEIQVAAVYDEHGIAGSALAYGTGLIKFCHDGIEQFLS